MISSPQTALRGSKQPHKSPEQKGPLAGNVKSYRGHESSEASPPNTIRMVAKLLKESPERSVQLYDDKCHRASPPIRSKRWNTPQSSNKGVAQQQSPSASAAPPVAVAVKQLKKSTPSSNSTTDEKNSQQRPEPIARRRSVRDLISRYEPAGQASPVIVKRRWNRPTHPSYNKSAPSGDSASPQSSLSQAASPGSGKRWSKPTISASSISSPTALSSSSSSLQSALHVTKGVNKTRKWESIGASQALEMGISPQQTSGKEQNQHSEPLRQIPLSRAATQRSELPFSDSTEPKSHQPVTVTASFASAGAQQESKVYPSYNSATEAVSPADKKNTRDQPLSQVAPPVGGPKGGSSPPSIREGTSSNSNSTGISSSLQAALAASKREPTPSKYHCANQTRNMAITGASLQSPEKGARLYPHMSDRKEQQQQEVQPQLEPSREDPPIDIAKQRNEPPFSNSSTSEKSSHKSALETTPSVMIAKEGNERPISEKCVHKIKFYPSALQAASPAAGIKVGTNTSFSDSSIGVDNAPNQILSSHAAPPASSAGQASSSPSIMEGNTSMTNIAGVSSLQAALAASKGGPIISKSCTNKTRRKEASAATMRPFEKAASQQQTSGKEQPPQPDSEPSREGVTNVVAKQRNEPLFSDSNEQGNTSKQFSFRAVAPADVTEERSKSSSLRSQERSSRGTILVGNANEESKPTPSHSSAPDSSSIQVSSQAPPSNSAAEQGSTSSVSEGTTISKSSGMSSLQAALAASKSGPTISKSHINKTRGNTARNEQRHQQHLPPCEPSEQVARACVAKQRSEPPVSDSSTSFGGAKKSSKLSSSHKIAPKNRSQQSSSRSASPVGGAAEQGSKPLPVSKGMSSNITSGMSSLQAALVASKSGPTLSKRNINKTRGNETAGAPLQLSENRQQKNREQTPVNKQQMQPQFNPPGQASSVVIAKKRHKLPPSEIRGEETTSHPSSSQAAAPARGTKQDTQVSGGASSSNTFGVSSLQAALAASNHELTLSKTHANKAKGNKPTGAILHSSEKGASHQQAAENTGRQPEVQKNHAYSNGRKKFESYQQEQPPEQQYHERQSDQQYYEQPLDQHYYQQPSDFGANHEQTMSSGYYMQQPDQHYYQQQSDQQCYHPQQSDQQYYQQPSNQQYQQQSDSSNNAHHWQASQPSGHTRKQKSHDMRHSAQTTYHGEWNESSMHHQQQLNDYYSPQQQNSTRTAVQTNNRTNQNNDKARMHFIPSNPEDGTSKKLVWTSKRDYVPLADEIAMRNAVFLGKKKEFGMLEHAAPERLAHIREMCEKLSITFFQAASLRDHFLLKHHRFGNAREKLGLLSETIIKEAATIFEECVGVFLSEHQISYVDKAEQRRIQPHNSSAPDFLFRETVELQWKNNIPCEINWVECKMFYGASTVPTLDSESTVGRLLATIRMYVEMFGPGAILFAYGCGDQLACKVWEAGAIAVDADSIDLLRFDSHLKQHTAAAARLRLNDINSYDQPRGGRGRGGRGGRRYNYQGGTRR